MNVLRLLFLLFFCLWLGVAPAANAGRRAPAVVDDALAFALTDRDKAIQLLEEAAETASSRDLDLISVYAGEQRRLAGDTDAAHVWFSAVLSRNAKGSEADAARLGLALIQVGQGVEKNLKLLRDIPEKGTLDTQNADRYMHLALRAATNNNSAAMKEHTTRSLRYAAEDPAVLARVRETLESLRPGEAPPPVAEPPRRADPLDRADQALADGKPDEARRIAESLLQSEPDNRAAAYLIRRIDAAPVSMRRVAVLLPLEGKYGGVGKQVQQALEFGLDRAGGGFELEFVDSGATSDSAVAALEDAVLNGGAIGVVGPLLSDETEAVVQAAEDLRVPLISLSQSLETPEELTFVLQAMMTVGDQVDALLDSVMDQEGMKNFAVFRPDSSYGERATTLFQEAVEARGGAVTIQQAYDPASTDLVPFAKTFGRKDYEARKREFWDLKREIEEKGGDPARAVLPPIIDFDAIFLPDNANRVPLACAALAYEEFPMGDFLPTRESPTIPLLGLSGWNNHNLVGTGGPYARRSFFTDAFLTALTVDDPPWEPPEAVTEFVEAYREATGRTPSPLEAIVVDAAQILAAASEAGAQTRPALLEALLGVNIETGVTGATGFDPETRRAARQLLVLSVSEDAIVPRAELPPPEVER